MKLPKKVKIGHRNFSIKVVPELFDEGKEIQGITNFDDKTITILKRSDFTAVLMHEIEHGILRHLGISEALSDKEEEIIVEGLANMHIELIKDNPFLIPLLKK